MCLLCERPAPRPVVCARGRRRLAEGRGESCPKHASPSSFDNGDLGIDLAPFFGVSKNDGQDKDGGANDTRSFPEFKRAADDGTTTVAEGKVPFPDPQSLTLEIFVNDAPDASGHGEGETFLATATADAKGRFTVTLPGGLAGKWLTGTATDTAGNTSEFSQAIEVRAAKK